MTLVIDLYAAAHEALGKIQGAEEFFPQHELDTVLKKVAQNPLLSAAPRPVVEQAVKDAFSRHLEGYAKLSAAEHGAYKQSFLADGIGAIERTYKKLAGAETPSALRNYRDHGLVRRWQNLSGQDKTWTGISLGFAALSAVLAVDSFRHSRNVDPETGKRRTNWTQVGFGVLNTALAASLALAGASYLRSGGAIRQP